MFFAALKGLYIACFFQHCNSLSTQTYIICIPTLFLGFAACESWLIKDDNVNNCDCSLFKSPVLRHVCLYKWMKLPPQIRVMKGQRSGTPFVSHYISNVCNSFGSCILPPGLQELFQSQMKQSDSVVWRGDMSSRASNLHCKYPYTVASNMPATWANLQIFLLGVLLCFLAVRFLSHY